MRRAYIASQRWICFTSESHSLFSELCSHTCRAALRSVARIAPTFEEKMSAETILAGVVTVVLLVYLFYTLLRPEKF